MGLSDSLVTMSVTMESGPYVPRFRSPAASIAACSFYLVEGDAMWDIDRSQLRKFLQRMYI